MAKNRPEYMAEYRPEYMAWMAKNRPNWIKHGWPIIGLIWLIGLIGGFNYRPKLGQIIRLIDHATSKVIVI